MRELTGESWFVPVFLLKMEVGNMTGKDIIEWIKENNAENDEIYIEVKPKLFKASSQFEILGSEDCPCFDMIILR